MNQDNRKIYGTDRFIPSRNLVDFDAAYFNLTFPNIHCEDEVSLLNFFSYNKRAEFKKNLESVANLNQRIFKTSKLANSFRNNATPNKLQDQIWPCTARKKPCLVNEKILDLPDFNTGFHLTQTIDWGRNDVIVTSVKNKIIAGSGFSGKSTTTEAVTEYDGDLGTAVAWSGNGVNLAVGTENGLVEVWDLDRKKLIVREKCCGIQCTVTSLQWHPMHHSLAWACSRGKISKRDFRKNITMVVEVAHDGCICTLKYSPKANYLCSTGQDAYVRIWRGDTCDPYMEIEMSHPVSAVAWHPWRTGLLAVGEGHPNSGMLSIWNVNTAQLQFMTKPSKPVAIKSIGFNRLSGEMVYSQTMRGENGEDHCDVVVLGGAGELVDVSPQGRGCVTSLLWSPDGTKLGTAGTDETLRIFKFHPSQEQVKRKRKRTHDVMAFNKCITMIR